ncbi:arylesterase [Flammeovirga yaeyamensis]|uniref:Arylesterase n=1 Tax=Flammeovirga yaeyamensis TaxID=367791 RepID=A0AAX1N435_9BACT|nr:arylesterase [Flammeovirga yaeyamensis]MBB3699796.1 acyl-CoA thioesterase-1 [Flammeovirga yaeyamensis]NMF36635.1 arylesterase [Flammeovirga yaeyamensis]QWG02319.1 arylesterase [Flammeovirga yaeyamensis]
MKLKLLLILFLFIFFSSCQEKNNQQKKENVQESSVKETTTSDKKNIVFFGNSLTAGYGLEKEQAYPSLIQKMIDDKALGYNCINAGLSGETTAGGLNRVDWVIGQEQVDVFVLALGGNDALRGIDPKSTEDNLINTIQKVKSKYPDCKILLAGILPPPNMGDEYSKAFETLYPRIAKKENVKLMPFILKDVAGVKELNQEDGIHPNEEGAKILAKNIFAELQSLL